MTFPVPGRFDRDGAVLLRGLVPAPLARSLAAGMTSVLAAHGWAMTGPAAAGTECGPVPARPGWTTLAPTARDRRAYREICASQALHRLGHHPLLVAAVADLLGDTDLLLHPRPVVRVIAPVSMTDQPPTPAHQDHVNMQGTRRAVVAWVALTPCPLEAGPLAVAVGSHRAGPRPHRPASGSGVLSCPEVPGEEWASEAVAPGDVVLFDALSVHRALPNRSERFRLSVDLRYQRRSDPICALSLGGYGDLGWDEIYSGWEPVPADAPDRPYYWRDMDLVTVAYDPGYHRAA